MEAPAVELLRECGEVEHYRAFRRLTDAYFASFDSGNSEAIATMIDFYGGIGTFASWPQRVRTYAMDTTAVNIRDWASAYAFSPPLESLAAINLPVLIARGASSHPAIQRANVLLSEHIRDAALATIDGAAHFMIVTHARAVAHLIEQHVQLAERHQTSRTMPQVLCPI
jgi:pimeloyl-ACP methyl ester carboxylesterase